MIAFAQSKKVKKDSERSILAESDAVEQACRDTALSMEYAASVHAYLSQDESEWPACCGSSCEPCVLALENAARRALKLLNR
jgi:hypothetical protein